MQKEESFKPTGNMGCRLWWGKPSVLRERNLGAWDGGWLMGVNGPQPGRFDLAFERWCRKNGHLYVRTVNIFWAFEYHRRGFPMKLDQEVIQKDWLEAKRRRDEAPRLIREGRIISMTPRINLKNLRAAKLREYVDEWYPDPGPWSEYFKERKEYFTGELERYQQALAFWNECGQFRKVFIRCAKFSNRRPETHPDYIVVFRRQKESRFRHGFVEVKGPREWLRPSQKRFFPELVSGTGQNVWVVRLKEDCGDIRFFVVNSDGTIEACGNPGLLQRSGSHA